MSGLEPTYTLTEARAELAQRECARWGHDWEIISMVAGPVALRCGCCPRAYRVTDEPATDPLNRTWPLDEETT